MSDYKRVFAFTLPFRRHILAAIALSLIFTFAYTAVIPLLKTLTQAVVDKNQAAFLAGFIKGIGIIAVYLVAKYCQRYLSQVIAIGVENSIRKKVYRKIVYQPASFFSGHNQGDLMARLFNDCFQVSDVILNNLKSVLPSLIMVISVLGYLFYTYFFLTLSILVTLVVFGLATHSTGQRVRKIAGYVQDRVGGLFHFSSETWINIPVVKTFRLEEFFTNKFNAMTADVVSNRVRNIRSLALLEGFIEVIQVCTVMGLLWVCGGLVISGKMSGVNLMAYFSGIILMGEPVISLSSMFNQNQQMLASAARIFEILDSPQEIHSQAHSLQIPDLKGPIQFENIHFSYEPGRAVLSGLNISVDVGETVALVGESGSGKSTFISLIPRLYDPQEGSIKIYGTSIQDLDLNFLRDRIGIVSQDHFIFSGTIMENLMMGNLKATPEEIQNAVENANAWEFIKEMPDTYHAQIGDRGLKLSGGQKQRLSIARAFLRNPDILILDEPTSALDAKSEQLVQEALLKLMKNRTTFVIAHRLSTIRQASKIVVLNKGKIDAIGTHESLLEEKGIYYALYRLQFHASEI